MRRGQHKSTPRVVDGKVQRKNRSAQTPNPYNTPQNVPTIDKERPGQGYRHIVRKRDLIQFIGILPDWDELSRGLNVVLLAPGECDVDGWHDTGIVAICAWERELARTMIPWYYNDHKDIFNRIGVQGTKSGNDYRADYRLLPGQGQ